jgi:hypothetical protein
MTAAVAAISGAVTALENYLPPLISSQYPAWRAIKFLPRRRKARRRLRAVAIIAVDYGPFGLDCEEPGYSFMRHGSAPASDKSGS